MSSERLRAIPIGRLRSPGRDTAPHRATPRRATPRRSAPHRAAPRHTTPRRPAPRATSVRLRPAAALALIAAVRVSAAAARGADRPRRRATDAASARRGNNVNNSHLRKLWKNQNAINLKNQIANKFYSWLTQKRVYVVHNDNKYLLLTLARKSMSRSKIGSSGKAGLVASHLAMYDEVGGKGKKILCQHRREESAVPAPARAHAPSDHARARDQKRVTCQASSQRGVQLAEYNAEDQSFDHPHSPDPSSSNSCPPFPITQSVFLPSESAGQTFTNPPQFILPDRYPDHPSPPPESHNHDIPYPHPHPEFRHTPDIPLPVSPLPPSPPCPQVGHTQDIPPPDYPQTIPSHPQVCPANPLTLHSPITHPLHTLPPPGVCQFHHTCLGFPHPQWLDLVVSPIMLVSASEDRFTLKDFVLKIDSGVNNNEYSGELNKLNLRILFRWLVGRFGIPILEPLRRERTELVRTAVNRQVIVDRRESYKLLVRCKDECDEKTEDKSGRAFHWRGKREENGRREQALGAVGGRRARRKRRGGQWRGSSAARAHCRVFRPGCGATAGGRPRPNAAYRGLRRSAAAEITKS
ncbi:Protein of unknown function [Gryllus bimaculatus]|nr:Protein of unknown function [Gryllus bimaculatus]